MEFVQRFTDSRADASARVFRFSVDTARYFTQIEKPLEVAMVISTAYPMFVGGTNIAIAAAFGDQATVDRITARLDS